VQFNIVINTRMHHIVVVDREMRVEGFKLKKNVCCLLSCKKTSNYDTPIIEFIIFRCFLCLMIQLQKSKTISLRACGASCAAPWL